jgi:hypothetical protein
LWIDVDSRPLQQLFSSIPRRGVLPKYTTPLFDGILAPELKGLNHAQQNFMHHPDHAHPCSIGNCRLLWLPALIFMQGPRCGVVNKDF